MIFDVTHSIRKYGIPSSDPSGGLREYLPALARAGVAAGVDGLFIEVHPDPENALCDASSQLNVSDLGRICKTINRNTFVGKKNTDKPYGIILRLS